MAHLFRKTITRYLDADDNRVPKGTPGARKVRERSRDWYGRFRDAERILRQVRLSPNKEAARQLLTDLVKAAELGKAGIVNPFAEHHKLLLTAHVEAYRRHLAAKGNSERHVNETAGRVESLLTGCGFKRISDISASRVSSWLADRRAEDGTETEDGGQVRFGARTSNHYLTAAKGFARWLVKDRRTADDPLIHLSGLNADTDVRRERRHLTGEDFSRLLSATRTNGDRCGLSGRDRELLYLTAAYTGLRASELASLTPASIDLDADGPTVTVEAAYSKRRRRDVLPLHPELTTRLREWL